MIKDIKYNGYTATPSDYECPDGDLAGAYNLVPEDGALHPILPPATKFTIPDGYTLAFIHHPSPDVKNYILTDGGDLYWVTEQNPTPGNEPFGTVPTPIYQINAIGNTLLALTPSGIYYFLWKNGNYLALGNKIPEPKLSFSLDNNFVYSDNYIYYIGGGELGQRWIDYRNNGKEFETQDKSAYNAVLMAQLNKLMAEKVTGAGKFNMPFLVRYAVRLYDGSLTLHSAPVLMLPYGMKVYETQYTTGDGGKVWTIGFRCVSGSSKLEVAALQNINLGNWEDIVSSIDVFISAPLYTYNQAGAVDRYHASIFTTKAITRSGTLYTVEPRGIDVAPRHTDDDIPSGATLYDSLTIPQFENYEAHIKECQNFYLLHSFKPSEITTTRTPIDVGNEYLQSLVAREVMTDDYQSHDTLAPSYSFAFNSRMNIANVMRNLFKGYSPFSAFCFSNNASQDEVEIFVEIKNDMGNIVVKSDTQTLNYTPLGIVYFYYPDPMARRAWIKIGLTVYQVDLEPHIGLNGALFFSMRGLENYGIAPSVSQSSAIPLPNKVYTSEVNNPFFYPLSGINTVGTGQILGICAAVKALSQGQFGQFPLYCFTTEGVWALETSSTGSYIARQPITRDVCTNPDSITQLDDAVLFTSDRGIMLLSGSTCQCISDDINTDSPASLSDLPGLQQLLTSEQLSVPSLLPFSQFLDGCRMIYDYTHQRIIVYNTSKDYAYVYSLKDHKWSTMPTSIDYGVNSYPEALAVTDDGMLVDLSKDGNVTTGVKGLIITRPIKLEPDILKTWDTVIQRGYFNYLDSSRSVKPIRTILYGSRDLFHWHLVYSSTDHYLRGFRGTPYKFFRIVLLVDFRPDESVYGCTIQYNLRYTNRPR